MPSRSSASERGHPCPRCGALVSHDELQRAASRIGSADLLPSFRRSRNTRYWACLSCLDSGRVIIADPSKHDHLPTMGPAREYLFWDQQKTCKGCRAPFTFTAREQQVWYEQYRIPIEVDRVRCDDCQRRRRAEHTINDLMPGASPDDVNAAAALAEAYEIIGSPLKHAYWQKRLDALLAEGRRPALSPDRHRKSIDKTTLKSRIRARKRARKRRG